VTAGTVTFLFTDVAGSTRLLHALGRMLTRRSQSTGKCCARRAQFVCGAGGNLKRAVLVPPTVLVGTRSATRAGAQDHSAGGRLVAYCSLHATPAVVAAIFGGWRCS
jgi:hypothetical protein